MNGFEWWSAVTDLFLFFYIQGDDTDEVGTDYANLGESKRI